MIKVASWMWRCEPGVAAWHVEWAAMLNQPPLQVIDLALDDPTCKHLLIRYDERLLLEFLCMPVSDTCVEAYVRNPTQLLDRDLVMNFVERVRDRANTFKLIRQPLGFMGQPS